MGTNRQEPGSNDPGETPQSTSLLGLTLPSRVSSPVEDLPEGWVLTGPDDAVSVLSDQADPAPDADEPERTPGDATTESSTCDPPKEPNEAVADETVGGDTDGAGPGERQSAGETDDDTGSCPEGKADALPHDGNVRHLLGVTPPGGSPEAAGDRLAELPSPVVDPPATNDQQSTQTAADALAPESALRSRRSRPGRHRAPRTRTWPNMFGSDRSHRKLPGHVMATFADKDAALLKFDAALATAEPHDESGAVTAYRAELADLIGEVRPLPPQQVHLLLRDAGITGQLRGMHDTPAAVSAIGQVHQGEWVDGTQVAVKVVRPTVWQTYAAEVADLLGRTASIGRHLPGTDVPALLGSLRDGVGADLDLPGEAARQHAFHRLYADIGTGADGLARVQVPRVHLVAPTVLVTQWAPGQPLNEHAQLGRAASSRAAQALAAYPVTAVVETGMVHADLHPGNVLVTDAGDVTLVDFARCAGVPVRLPDSGGLLLRAVRARDAEGALRCLRALGVVASRSQMAPDDALAVATGVLGPLDSEDLSVDAALVGALRTVVARHGTRAPGPLSATLSAGMATLALLTRLGAPVDARSGLEQLPGLHALRGDAPLTRA